MSKASTDNAAKPDATKATTGKAPLGKYGAVIQQARSEENQKAIEPESQQSGLPDGKVKEEEANLSIKVPMRLRRHWAAESKRQGTTLTAVISAALTEKFGEPRDG